MTRVTHVVVSVMFIFSLALQVLPANANQRTFYSLTELEKEKLFLGDTVQLQTGVCWSSKKPTSKTSKVRLQIFVGDRWVNAGTTKFMLNTQCTGNSRKIYEQVFVWEVDRLGMVDSRFKYLGTLRLRNAATSPSEYAKVTILESREKLKDFEATQSLDFINWLNCQMNGGQWDESRALCVGGN
jgi:hypothetical protein